MQAVSPGLYPWRGRLGRLGYGVSMAVLALAGAVSVWVGLALLFNEYFPAALAVWGFCIAVAAWIGLGATARRLHDLGWRGGHAGWLLALAALALYADDHLPDAMPPLAGLLLALGAWLLLAPGQPSANRYGPPP